MNIQFNPALDLEHLRGEFAKHRRLRIENFLSDESAEYVAQHLQETTPWHLVHSDEQGLPVRYDPAMLAAMSDAEFAAIRKTLHQRAAHSYQYSYKFFPIIDAIKSGSLGPDSMLFQMASFLNGTDFIRFSRILTDTRTLVKVDPQATLYEAGHFLTTHDDSMYQRPEGDNSDRRYAMVLGFSKDWQRDWGGQTTFYPSMTASTSESWYPGFNTLSIFEVPILHCVNYVAPFADGGRYSITGWLRDDPDIKRPDLGDL